MIEREQHRADVQTLQVCLGAYLKEQQADLVDRITRTALERGYARYVPELRATLHALVHGISSVVAEFIASDEKTAFHPGEQFDRDPLVAFIRRETRALGARGVRSEVVVGLLQQCRDAYAACCRESSFGAQELCKALIALCFDRMELGLIAPWSELDRTSATYETTRRADADVAGSSSPSETDIEDVVEHRVTERFRELIAANEQLRRELDQRMRVEEERDLYYRALLHGQKLEAVGALAGGVAHELSNLFQVVRCNTDLLRERADRTSFGMLEEISQVTERAVGLVRQLLLFSRKQPMVRRVIDVGDVVRDLLRLLRRVMPENVRLFSEVEDKLPLVRADLSAIEQLVMNLIINARDSMPRGGTIHVNVSRQRRVPPERIRAASSMQQIGIFVRDVGIGMPEDVLTRIFDPFFTTKHHSSGLGLSVVHGVVEEHGGWVEVTSAVDQGSCFAIYLPVLDESLQTETVSDGSDEERYLGRGEHLLLVEDEEVVRRALGRELSRCGYSVQAVGTAEEALAIYRRAPGHFDCIISDGLMPGMSGPEMVLEMLKDNARQRAIFISGYAPTMDCWPELQSRGFRLLAKPFATRELVVALREAIEQEREMAALTLRTPLTSGGVDDLLPSRQYR